MYGWGGSTSDWRGKAKKDYDFGSARAKYDKIAADASGPRVYSRKREPDMDLVDPRGKKLVSKSKNPIVIGVDVTGSMANWPGEIFDRLPLLYQTLGKYEEDLEICFAAIGDATSDSYPLQVNDFGKGAELEKKLKALGCEGGGGGHITESYELFGHFMNTRCELPNAKSPFLIIYGDETFYDRIKPKEVKHYIGDSLESPLESKTMWKELMTKFNVYHLHKPYDHSDRDDEIKRNWKEALGDQRVIDLPSMERSVDVAIGLIAKHWGEYNDFKKSLDARHDDSGVKASVHASLRHIDTDPVTTSVVKKSLSRKLSKTLD